MSRNRDKGKGGKVRALLLLNFTLKKRLSAGLVKLSVFEEETWADCVTHTRGWAGPRTDCWGGAGEGAKGLSNSSAHVVPRIGENGTRAPDRATLSESEAMSQKQN